MLSDQRVHHITVNDLSYTFCQ